VYHGSYRPMMEYARSSAFPDKRLGLRAHMPIEIAPTKLDALTSLRFIAAAMIVITHSYTAFGMEADALQPFNFGQAVSFFFVLSGFILTWVYPELKGTDIRQFFIARFARIWPAHLTTLTLIFVLFSADQRHLHESDSWWMLSANLMLIHAWIPYKSCCYHYNTVSWSVSTEVFFYLCFPLLIRGLQSRWWVNLLGAAAMVLGMITLCNSIPIPDGLEAMKNGVSAHVMMYNHPVSRLFEFVLGMSFALLFRKLRSFIKINVLFGSLIELATFALLITMMYYSGRIASELQGAYPFIGVPSVLWMFSGGICSPFFGLLIVAMALNLGHVSWFLSRRPFVLLGEISYSIYLLHFVLLRYYLLHKDHFNGVPLWAQSILFWTVMIISSYLMWRFIEKPFRKELLRLGNKKQQT